jgi:hypothetical protein
VGVQYHGETRYTDLWLKHGKVEVIMRNLGQRVQDMVYEVLLLPTGLTSTREEVDSTRLFESNPIYRNSACFWYMNLVGIVWGNVQ